MWDLVKGDNGSDEEEKQPKLKRARNNTEAVKIWLENIKDNKKEKLDHVLKIYCMAPFLFGQVYQKEKVIQFAHDTDLLPVECETRPRDTIPAFLMKSLDLMEDTIELVNKQIYSEKTLKNMIALLEKIESFDSVTVWIKESRDNRNIKLWSEELRKKHFSNENSQEEEKIIFAILFVVDQYITHVFKFTKEGKDVCKEFEEECRAGEKKADFIRSQGNNSFKEHRYRQAITKYSEAALMSVYNYVIYGNRALAFINNKEFENALADGRRSIILSPTWHKGHYRYAHAFSEMGFLSKALEANEKALKYCPGNKDLEEQRERLMEFKKARDNDLPELVEASSSEESEIEDSDEEVPSLKSGSESDSDSEKSIPKKSEEEKAKLRKEVDEAQKKEIALRAQQLEEEEKKRKEEDILKKRKLAREAEMKQEKLNMFKREKELEKKQEEEVKKYEDERKKIKEEKLKEKPKKPFDELNDVVIEGSEALQENRIRVAVRFLSKAMDIIQNNPLAYIDMEDEYVYRILYCLGTAYVETGINGEILKGVKQFERILEGEKRYVLAHYGLGKAYMKQNRFAKALENFERGWELMGKYYLPIIFTYPGKNEVEMPEGEEHRLKNLFQEHMTKCRNPPTPDAVCRYKHCARHMTKEQIYKDDPDFAGFVRLLCDSHCELEYHIVCWKKIKSADRNKPSDKEFLKRPCFTPDCGGVVFKLTIINADGEKQKEIVDTVPQTEPKAEKSGTHKMQGSSQKKAARKQAKKAARKQKKAEEKEAEKEKSPETDILDIIENIENKSKQGPGSLHSENMSNVTDNGSERGSEVSRSKTPPINLDQHMTVLKKNEDEPQDLFKGNKKSKNKKKKEKNKTSIPLNMFVGPQEEDTPIDSIDGEERSMPLDPHQPFSVPKEIEKDVQDFENTFVPIKSFSSALKKEGKFESKNYGSTIENRETKDQLIIESIQSFFLNILRETGPMRIDDPRIDSNLEIFPSEASDLIEREGGLGKVLILSLDFAMIEPYICCLKDVAKAGLMAKEFKEELAKSHGHTVAQNLIDEMMAKQKPSIKKTEQPVLDMSDFPSLGGAPIQKQERQTFVPSSESVKKTSTIGNPYPALSLNVSKSSHVTNVTPNFASLSMKTDTTPSVQNPYAPILSPPAGLNQNHPLSNPSSVAVAGPSLSLSNVCKSGPSLSLSNVSKSGPSLSLSNVSASGPGPSLSLSGLPQKSSNSNVLKLDLGKELKNAPGTSNTGALSMSFASSSVSSSGINTSSAKKPEGGAGLNELSIEELGQLMTASGSKILANKPTRGVVNLHRRPPYKEAGQGDSVNNSGVLGMPAPGASRGLGLSLNDIAPSGRDTSLKSAPPGFGKVMSGTDPSDNKTWGDKSDLDQSSMDWKSSNGKSEETIVPLHEKSEPKLGPIGSKPSPKSKGPSSLQNPTQVNRTENVSPMTLGLDNILPQGGSSLSLFSDPNFGVPQTYTPKSILSWQDAIPTVSPDFRPKVEIIEMLVENDSSDSSPSELEGSGDEILKIVEKCDEDFIKENTEYVLENLQKHEAFKNDPALKENIENQLKQDVETSKRSVRAVTPPTVGKVVMSQDASVDTADLEAEVNSEYEQHITVLETKASNLQEKLTSAMDEKTKIQNKCTMEVKKLNSKIEDVQEQKKKLEATCTQNDADKKKLKDDLKAIKAQLKAQKHHEETLQKNIDEKNVIISELQRILQDEKHKFEREKQDVSGAINRLTQKQREEQQKAEIEQERAKKAEIQILQMKAHFCLQMLDKNKNDADIYIKNIRDILLKCNQDETPVPQHLPKALEAWMKTSREIKALIMDYKQKTDLHITKIQEGINLSDLPVLEIPRPPPAPDMNALMRENAVANIPSVSQNNRVQQNNGPPPQAPPAQRQNPLPPPSGMQRTLSMQLPAGRVGAAAPNFGAPRPPGLSLNPQLVGGIAPPRHSQGQAKNSFDKIVDKVNARFPQYPRTNITKHIQDIRASRSGSLTGMALDDIVERVCQMITQEQQRNSTGMNMQVSSSINSLSHFSASVVTATPQKSWGTLPSQALQGGIPTMTNGEIFEEEEDPCIICHDEMTHAGTVTLDCKHRYHDECIRKWFKEQTTCPTCRVHTLLPDEFPSLSMR